MSDRLYKISVVFLLTVIASTLIFHTIRNEQKTITVADLERLGTDYKARVDMKNNIPLVKIEGGNIHADLSEPVEVTIKQKY